MRNISFFIAACFSSSMVAGLTLGRRPPPTEVLQNAKQDAYQILYQEGSKLTALTAEIIPKFGHLLSELGHRGSNVQSIARRTAEAFQAAIQKTGSMDSLRSMVKNRAVTSLLQKVQPTFKEGAMRATPPHEALEALINNTEGLPGVHQALQLFKANMSAAAPENVQRLTKATADNSGVINIGLGLSASTGALKSESFVLDTLLHITAGVEGYISINTSDASFQICGGPSVGYPYSDGGELSTYLSLAGGLARNQPGHSWSTGLGKDFDGVKHDRGSRTLGLGLTSFGEFTYAWPPELVQAGLEICWNIGEATPDGPPDDDVIEEFDDTPDTRSRSGSPKAIEKIQKEALYRNSTSDSRIALPKPMSPPGYPYPLQCYGGFREVNLELFAWGFTWCSEPFGK